MTEENKQTLVDRLMKASGDEIRTAREKLGLSQAELAARVGTNQQTIDRLERSISKQSKFMPEIRRALNLPAADPIEDTLVKYTVKGNAGYGVRAHLAEDYRDPQKMAVFRLNEAESGVWIIDENPALFIARSYPVADQLNAYGIIVPNEDMSPVLRPGQIAVVNPDVPAELLSEVFMLHAMPDGRTAGMLCTWDGFKNSEPDAQGELMVKIRLWNPAQSLLARWLMWPAIGAVVAKVPYARD